MAIDSQKTLTALSDDARLAPVRPAQGMRRWTPLYVVASPRPAVGKTFVARLIVDFLRLDGAPAMAFDLNAGEVSLVNYLPDLTTKADIGSTKGQVALFDQLIAEDGISKVVDLGHALYEPFFTVVEEIRLIDEALRRTIEPVILFPADPHPASAQAYGDLHKRFPGLIVVPIFNEAFVKGRKLRDQFPFLRAASVPLQIPVLPPALKAHADNSAYSFADFHGQLPVAIPIGQAFELRAWTKRAFLEFRELELRLLLEKLRASLQ